MTLFTWLARRFTTRAAKQHHTDVSEQYLTSTLGPRPEWDTSNPYYMQLTSDMQAGPLPELEDDLRNIEEEQTRHTAPLLLTIVLFLLYGAEAVGSILIFRALGYDGAVRFILGAMLAALVFFITIIAAKQSERGQRTGWFYLAIIAYALLIVAITIVRVHEASTEDTSLLMELATGALMMFTSVGPALYAEYIGRQREVSVRLARRARQLRRRIRQITSRREHATQEHIRFGRELLAYGKRRQQLKSTYGVAQHDNKHDNKEEM
jgi:hypothetical protein